MNSTDRNQQQAPAGLLHLATDLKDCAGHFECYAKWNGALFDAIYKLTEPGGGVSHETLHNLASLGEFISENAYATACDYGTTAKGLKAE